MKDRTNQRGQVLVYFGIFGLVFFSLAAVAVDVGRHVFVGREVQAAADATALVGATTLARGWDAGTAITKATTFGSENTVDGHPAATGEVQVGNWDGSTFTLGGSPLNAVSTAPSVTVDNIFGLWTQTSTIQRKAVAAFQGAPQLPLVLCDNTASGGWVAGITLRLSDSGVNTAAWAVFDPQVTTFPGMSVVTSTLPIGCDAGQGWVPPPQTVGASIALGNGQLPQSLCGNLQPPCSITGKTYIFPVVDIPCCGPNNQPCPLNNQHKIIGFVTAMIDGVHCDSADPLARSIVAHVVSDCATTHSATLCPSAALVR